jgi:hypothetical protein
VHRYVPRTHQLLVDKLADRNCGVESDGSETLGFPTEPALGFLKFSTQRTVIIRMAAV